MYSESDLQSAVEAGAISAEAADAFRVHVVAQRSTPLVDEEHFRLLTGFNDIFVSLALIILGVAIGSLGSGLFIAAAAWPLAEYFTRKRRMALPSILLVGGFVGGTIFGSWGLLSHLPEISPNHDTQQAVILSMSAALGAGAAWLHWYRFKVPITIAAGAAAAAGVVIALLAALFPKLGDMLFLFVLLAGVLIFALAMRWDISDPTRTTRRADVAFWLHLAAAPMIAHSLFELLGVFDDSGLSMTKALVVLLLYLLFAVVALAVDRRALMVSSLAYVLYALSSLLKSAGVVDLSFALTALVIGSALLLLSAFWATARGAVMRLLPIAWAGRAVAFGVTLANPSPVSSTAARRGPTPVPIHARAGSRRPLPRSAPTCPGGCATTGVFR